MQNSLRRVTGGPVVGRARSLLPRALLRTGRGIRLSLPFGVHGSCAEKRFVYLTLGDLGREGSLRAAVLHVKVPAGTAKAWL